MYMYMHDYFTLHIIIYHNMYLYIINLLYFVVISVRLYFMTLMIQSIRCYINIYFVHILIFMCYSSCKLETKYNLTSINFLFLSISRVHLFICVSFPWLFNIPLICKSLPWPIARRPADVSWTWQSGCPEESGYSKRHSPRPVLASLPEDSRRIQREFHWLSQRRSSMRKL